MLEVNPETICFIIARAREIHVQEQAVIPAEPDPGSGDRTREVLAEHGDDLTLAETRGIIEDLDTDQQVALVALMWLGRGDYDPEDWDGALDAARWEWNAHLADQLLATPLVADFLEEGLALPGHSCGD